MKKGLRFLALALLFVVGCIILFAWDLFRAMILLALIPPTRAYEWLCRVLLNER